MRTEIIAGDTLDFETTVNDYPATDGWTLKFRLVPRVTGTAISITCATASDGVSYRAQVAPSTTANYVAGEYTWNSWVEKSGARQVVESGQVTILPDPAVQTAPYDNRSWAAKMLDAMETAWLAHMGGSPLRLEYSIGDRSVKYRDKAEFIKERNYLKQEVYNEDKAQALANGTGLGNKLQVRI